MRRTTRLTMLSALVALCLAGCASLLDTSVPTGRDFDLMKAKTIQDGVTTKVEVEALCGRPDAVNSAPTGDTWIFKYQRVNLGRRKTWGTGTQQFATQSETTVKYEKRLTVNFDPDGTVLTHSVFETGSRP